jgi:hypothetical protein
LLLVVACNVYDDSLLKPASDTPGAGNGSVGGSRTTGGTSASGGANPNTGGAGGTTTGGSAGSTAPNGGASGAGSGGDATTGGTGGIIGSGGSGGVTPAGGTSAGVGGSGGSAGTGGVIIPTGSELIDDMEDGNREIKRTSGRRGAYYLYHDGATGTQTPDPSKVPFMAEVVRDTSAWSLHTTATGYAAATIGFDLNNDGAKRLPYNASAYLGVSFYARIEGTSLKSMRVQFLDKTTDRSGGVCNPAETAPNEEQCLAHFGYDVDGLSTNWQLVTILFSQLQQPSWGKQAPQLDAANLYSIEFTWTDLTAAKTGMNLWIDDISFLKP